MDSAPRLAARVGGGFGPGGAPHRRAKAERGRTAEALDLKTREKCY